MRITHSMLARIGIQQIGDQRARLAKTQEQAMTGRRVNRPSDDPVDYGKILALKDASSQTGRFLRSIDLARTRIRTTEDALSGAEEAVSRARALAVAAGNTTNRGPDARDALKAQVASLFDEVVDFANVRAPGGGYLFSGLASDTPAFSVTGSFGSGTTPTVTFDGDTNPVEMEIDEGVYIDVTRDGANAFQGADDVFDALSRLWTGIDQDDPTAIQTALGDIERAREHLTNERAIVGGSERKADSFEQRLANQQENLVTQVSLLEDADAFEVYSNLTAQETALQATVQVNARLLQPTLLDYI